MDSCFETNPDDSDDRNDTGEAEHDDHGRSSQRVDSSAQLQPNTSKHGSAKLLSFNYILSIQGVPTLVEQALMMNDKRTS